MPFMFTPFQNNYNAKSGMASVYHRYFFIHFKQSLPEPLHGELLCGDCSAPGGKLRKPRRITFQGDEFFRETGDALSRPVQKPGPVLVHELRAALSFPRDDGRSGRHSFHEHHAQGLALRGEDGEMAERKDLGYFGRPAGEVHVFPEPELSDLRQERIVISARQGVADNNEKRPLAELFACGGQLQRDIVGLAGLHARNVAEYDAVAVGLEFLFPRVAPDGVRIGETVHFDAGTDKGDLLRLHSPRQEHRLLLVREHDHAVVEAETDMGTRHHVGADHRPAREPCHDQPHVVGPVERRMNEVHIILFYEPPQEKNVSEAFHGNAVIRDAHCLDRIGHEPLIAAAHDRHLVAHPVENRDLVQEDALRPVPIVLGNHLQNAHIISGNTLLLDERPEEPFVIIHHPLGAEPPAGPPWALVRHPLPSIGIPKDRNDLGGHFPCPAVHEHAGGAVLQGVPDAASIEGHRRLPHGQGLDHPDAEPLVPVGADHDIEVSTKGEYLVLRQPAGPENSAGKPQLSGPVLEFPDLSDACLRGNEHEPGVGEFLPDKDERVEKLYLVLPEVSDRPDEGDIRGKAEAGAQFPPGNGARPEFTQVDAVIDDAGFVLQGRIEFNELFLDVLRDRRERPHASQQEARTEKLRHLGRIHQDRPLSRYERCNPGLKNFVITLYVDDIVAAVADDPGDPENRGYSGRPRPAGGIDGDPAVPEHLFERCPGPAYQADLNPLSDQARQKLAQKFLAPAPAAKVVYKKHVHAFSYASCLTFRFMPSAGSETPTPLRTWRRRNRNGTGSAPGRACRRESPAEKHTCG